MNLCWDKRERKLSFTGYLLDVMQEDHVIHTFPHIRPQPTNGLTLLHFKTSENRLIKVRNTPMVTQLLGVSDFRHIYPHMSIHCAMLTLVPLLQRSQKKLHNFCALSKWLGQTTSKFLWSDNHLWLKYFFKKFDFCFTILCHVSHYTERSNWPSSLGKIISLGSPDDKIDKVKVQKLHHYIHRSSFTVPTKLLFQYQL